MPQGDNEPQPDRPHRPVVAVGLIERHDNHLIIVRKDGTDIASHRWQFPRGKARRTESPEAAMRRVANEQLGLEVEIVVGQPPLVEAVDGEEVELRYFFCGVIKGEPKGTTYAENRWVLKGQLRDYEFEPTSQHVVDWLLES